MGAIDDVAVTQASAVWELATTDPTMRRRDLARAGMRVGRDHVGSIVNTLVLAYAGASLPLLIVFTLSEQSLGIAANGEVLATEIIRTLVGSIGLVAAVPITTWLAARVVVDTVSSGAGGPPPSSR
ncbi:MAG: YibE/F family protein, partial [Actinomycetota bacterium]